MSQSAEQRELLHALGECVAAMTMQLKRESEEWIIPSARALEVWQNALQEGIAVLHSAEYLDTQDKHNPNKADVNDTSVSIPAPVPKYRIPDINMIDAETVRARWAARAANFSVSYRSTEHTHTHTPMEIRDPRPFNLRELLQQATALDTNEGEE